MYSLANSIALNRSCLSQIVIRILLIFKVLNISKYFLDLIKEGIEQGEFIDKEGASQLFQSFFNEKNY